MNDPALLVAEYVFAHLRARHGRRWLGARAQGRAALSEEERRNASPADLLRTYQLYGVAGDSHAGLLGWLEGRYPLDLLTRIPSPPEMLRQQCEGRRYVTLMLEPEAQFRTYGRHKGALEFLLHDLEHAHKFFVEPELRDGQIAFFRLLQAEPPPAFPGDAEYQTGLDYLMSDMNSHPLHLLKYLKAIVLGACQRAGRRADYEAACEDLFRRWSLPPDELAAALRLNRPGLEHPEDHTVLASWFMRTF